VPTDGICRCHCRERKLRYVAVFGQLSHKLFKMGCRTLKRKGPRNYVPQRRRDHCHDLGATILPALQCHRLSRQSQCRPASPPPACRPRCRSPRAGSTTLWSIAWHTPLRDDRMVRTASAGADGHARGTGGTRRPDGELGGVRTGRGAVLLEYSTESMRSIRCGQIENLECSIPDFTLFVRCPQFGEHLDLLLHKIGWIKDVKGRISILWVGVRK
jgi:hypothetical protein